MSSSPEATEGSTEPIPRAAGAATGRRAALIAALLVLAGVANNLRSLGWGFVYDDYAHRLFLRHPEDNAPARPWSLYDWGDCPGPEDPFYESGALPWWTSPDFKVRFFRPVASLSILLDYVLYDDWAPGYHLTSLILYAMFLALAFKLYRDLGAPGSAALWALALLALEDAHFLPVGWIANRNTLLASLFTIAALLGVHHHHRKGHGAYLLLAGFCFLLACGSKESALAAYPIVALYLLLFDRCGATTSPSQRVGRLLRCRAFWVFTFLTAGYLTFYLFAGYGSHSVVYPTPWSDPAGYLNRLVVLAPVALLSLFFGFVADVLPDHPQLILPVVGTGVLLLSATAFILFRAIRLTRLSGLALGWIVFSLLTEAGGDLSDRLLMNASVGTALLVGLFFESLRPLRDCLAARQYPRVILAGVLLLTGLVVSVPSTALRSHFFMQLAGGDTKAIVEAPIDLGAPPPRDVFLLNSPSSMLALSMSATWRASHDDRDTRIFALQMCRRALTWTRLDDKSMALTSGGTPFCTGRFERILCADRSSPPPGATYRTVAFTATVVKVDEAGIRKVRFRFEKSVDDASYCFLGWQEGRLTRITPPSVGETVLLPQVEPPHPFTP